MNIAVTAASGQLGRAIINALLEQGKNANVIGLARTPENARDLNVEIRPGDYSDPVQLTSSLAGINRLILISGMDAPEQRIEQHRNVIQAAVVAGVSKIVYTSIQGAEQGNAFAPIVQSNRQTEADVRTSGLAWAIGRNGIYIEPDVEYIETYRASGEIANCAGAGKCGYTTRPELACAYAHMLMEDQHDGQTYNLHGEMLTQQQLAEFLNSTFKLNLRYREMNTEDYKAERIAELGEFIGTVIAGIYTGIREGAFDNPSDFARATGRAHQSWDNFFSNLNFQSP